MLNNYDPDIVEFIEMFKPLKGIDFETWSQKIHEWCYLGILKQVSQAEYDALSDEVFMSYYGSIITGAGSIKEPLNRFEENISKQQPRDSDERRVVENKKKLVAVFKTIGRYFGH